MTLGHKIIDAYGAYGLRGKADCETDLDSKGRRVSLVLCILPLREF